MGGDVLLKIYDLAKPSEANGDVAGYLARPVRADLCGLRESNLRWNLFFLSILDETLSWLNHSYHTVCFLHFSEESGLKQKFN